MWGLWLVLASLVQAPPSEGVLVDKIVAVVNKDIIAWSEVKEAMASKPLRFLLSPQGAPKEGEILQYLIENKLILQEVSYLSYLGTDPLELEVALKHTMKNYPTEDEFRKTLEGNAISQEALKGLLEPQLRGVEFIRRRNRFTADVQDPGVVLQLFEDWLKGLKEKADIQYPE